MPEYRATTDVAAQANQVFDYLADVGNLPAYFDRMTSAAPAADDAVNVTAKLPGGREVEGTAWFRVNREDQTLAWGSEGPNDYHGRLEVTADGPDVCTVTVFLHTARAETDEIQTGLERTLSNVKRISEAN